MPLCLRAVSEGFQDETAAIAGRDLRCLPSWRGGEAVGSGLIRPTLVGGTPTLLEGVGRSSRGSILLETQFGKFGLEKPQCLGQFSIVMSAKPFHLQLTAIYEAAPEGGYTSTFEELPDVFSEGETLEEAKTNLMDALDLVLGYHRDQARARQRQESSTVRETFEFATP